MAAKQWIKRLFLTTFIIVILPVSAIMGFNFYIDPLWNFSHKNEYNDYQIGFDERQQKTNYMNSREHFEYDSLLMGTSRVTYMNEHVFKKEDVFNYSVSGFRIDEYLPYIQYATEKNGKEFKTIYLELYINSYDKNVKSTHQDPSVYIEKAEDPFYKITSLFSYNTLQSALENFKISKANHYSGPRSYNRENVAQTSYSNPELWNQFETNFQAAASQPFVYNEEYKAKLIELKNTFPNTKFIVFTDLIPAKRLEMIVSNEEHRKAYERWFREMIDVFGEIYSFHGTNSVTTNPNNFLDVFHFYPSIGDQMIKAIEEPYKHKDILTIVDKEHLHNYLESR